MGGKGSGRKPRSWRQAAVNEAMAISAQEGAGYIKAVLSEEIPVDKIDWKLIDLAKFAINHSIGLPRTKAEVIFQGEVIHIPYAKLIMLAEERFKERRELEEADRSRLVEGAGQVVPERVETPLAAKVDPHQLS